MARELTGTVPTAPVDPPEPDAAVRAPRPVRYGPGGRVAAVGWRAVQAVPIALGATLLTFLLVHLIPGDPARSVLGARATPRAIAAFRAQWGLDEPLPVQYLRYLGRVLHGDLGTSLFYDRSAASVIAAAAVPTAWLVVAACVLSVLVSVPLAVLAAVFRGRAVDQLVRLVAQIGLGVPAPWIGLLLVVAFALRIRLFPAGGFGDGFAEHVPAVVLPGLTVAIGISPILIRSLRAELLEVLGSDYVTTARSKGLREARVLVRHALRNAAIAAVSVLGLNLAWLVSGSVVVEQVFALPGLGSLLVESIMRRDFPVVQGLALVFALLVIAVNLLTDAARSALDPRIGLR